MRDFIYKWSLSLIFEFLSYVISPWAPFVTKTCVKLVKFFAAKNRFKTQLVTRTLFRRTFYQMSEWINSKSFGLRLKGLRQLLISKIFAFFKNFCALLRMTTCETNLLRIILLFNIIDIYWTSLVKEIVIFKIKIYISIITVYTCS